MYPPDGKKIVFSSDRNGIEGGFVLHAMETDFLADVFQ
ncbi:PD40 domain-containing protein [Kordiimonas sp. SCSIO 12610]|nr:PD40 domain-containing protein [Kordiimonas sp. SCSIO 12610]